MSSFLQKPLLDPTRRAILDHARELSRVLEDAWNPAPVQDDVTLLAADLLDAHADTGIELNTWPHALAVVTNAVLADARAAHLLPAGHRTQAGFTVIGTWADSGPQPLAIVTGRQGVDTAVGVWQRQVSATNPAEAARLALI